VAIVIRMPEVLAGALEGVISKWAVAEGDEVKVGDVLAEIETDKASVEYQAEEAGTVARLIKSEGAMVDVGEPIAVFASAGDTDADIDKALADAGASSAAEPADDHVAEPAPATSSAQAPAAVPLEVVATPVRAAGERVFASPIVRKMAKERGVDLAGVPGTGPSGRIVRKDLEAYLASGAAHAAPAAASQPAATTPLGSAQFTEIPHTSMRRAIARRLTESKSTVPHFYLTADCRVDRLLQARAEVNEGLGIKTSVNDWVIKAVGHALMAVPGANVVWTDQAMRQFSQADISVAVATEGGLYTPVLRGVDRLSIPAISAQVKELADKARSGKIKQEDIEGGSFAVTNLGMFGTEEFSAILNPPQSGILAVGAAKEKPVVIDGALAVAQVMTVTLSADHRAVDGALAAQWMVAFQKAIENPLSLLL
jgi:pyruvate dehydrogenase E2 component (dihydrolipoamide acetyltransferase)